jgi:hypothetical protein
MERFGGITMENKEEDKGFVVRDRRFSAEKEGEKESTIKNEEGKKEELHRQDSTGQEAPLPEINFTDFLLSISTSTLIQLGEIPDPVTKQPVKQLPLAKQTIDLIGVLKEKTKGNLTPEEEKLIDYLLYDLRMRFIKAAS